MSPKVVEGGRRNANRRENEGEERRLMEKSGAKEVGSYRSIGAGRVRRLGDWIRLEDNVGD